MITSYSIILSAFSETLLPPVHRSLMLKKMRTKYPVSLLFIYKDSLAHVLSILYLIWLVEYLYSHRNR